MLDKNIFILFYTRFYTRILYWRQEGVSENILKKTFALLNTSQNPMFQADASFLDSSWKNTLWSRCTDVYLVRVGRHVFHFFVIKAADLQKIGG